jgi:hypothetical protein
MPEPVAVLNNPRAQHFAARADAHAVAEAFQLVVEEDRVRFVGCQRFDGIRGELHGGFGNQGGSRRLLPRGTYWRFSKAAILRKAP